VAACRAVEKREVVSVVDGIYLELSCSLHLAEAAWGPVRSADLPMQMCVIPVDVYSSIKYKISLKFCQHT